MFNMPHSIARNASGESIVSELDWPVSLYNAVCEHLRHLDWATYAVYVRLDLLPSFLQQEHVVVA